MSARAELTVWLVVPGMGRMKATATRFSAGGAELNIGAPPSQRDVVAWLLFPTGALPVLAKLGRSTRDTRRGELVFAGLPRAVMVRIHDELVRADVDGGDAVVVPDEDPLELTDVLDADPLGH